MSKIISCLFFLLLLSQSGYSQFLKDWMEAGNEAYEAKNYYGAYRYYQAAGTYPNAPDSLWFRYAQSARYFRIYKVALESYQRALDGADTRHHPEAAYWLAVVQQRLNGCEAAVPAYQQFIDRYQNQAPDSLLTKANQAIQACAIMGGAAFTEAEPVVGDSTHHLSRNINSDYSEFGPLYRGDTLYYTSLRFEYKKDNYRPRRNYAKLLRAVGEKDTPVLLSDSLNADGFHTADLTFSPDGGTVFFSRCEYAADGSLRCDLYRARRDGHDKWSRIEKLPFNGDSYTTTQPSPGALQDGSPVLFFSSNRPGSQGLDIWYAPLDRSGNVGSVPRRMPVINTEGDEVSPSFHTASGRLYFSSDGHPGFGGLDVFWSAQDASGQWSAPINLQAPVNSSEDDAFYVRSDDGSSAIFTSSRPESYCILPSDSALCYDLYTVAYRTKVELQLAVTNVCSPDETVSNATISLFEVLPNGERRSLDLNSNRDLQLYRRYLIEASHDQFRVDTSIVIDRIPPSGVLPLALKLPVLPPQGDLIVRLNGVKIDEETETRTPRPFEGGWVQLLKKTPDGRFEPTGKPQLQASEPEFTFTVTKGETYQVKVVRPLYEIDPGRYPSQLLQSFVAQPETITAGGCRWENADTITMVYQPIVLYFDNNIPGPSSRLVKRTDTSYVQTYNAYVKRKDRYIDVNRRIAVHRDTFLRDSAFLDNFFVREIKKGQDSLSKLPEKLKPFLDDFSFDITITGSASPLGDSIYNQSLSLRRISSVGNYITAKIPADKVNRLTFQPVPQGEPAKTRNRKDDIRRRTRDIFGVDAAITRKVEVSNIEIINTARSADTASADNDQR